MSHRWRLVVLVDLLPGRHEPIQLYVRTDFTSPVTVVCGRADLVHLDLQLSDVLDPDSECHGLRWVE